MLDVRQEQRVAVLTMNRPRQRNAMSADLVAALIEACLRASNDPAVGAIVLAGADPGFCAGSDLAGLAAMGSAARSHFEADSGRLARLFGTLPVPVVAAVHGFAIGGGLTLAAACDVVVSHPAARWSLPEVPIGLFPAWGLQAVSARIGQPAARRLAWGAETWTGMQAHQIGLADHLADPDVLADSIARATALSALPRAQVAAVKAFFADPAAEPADAHANAAFMDMCATPEGARTLDTFARRSRDRP